MVNSLFKTVTLFIFFFPTFIFGQADVKLSNFFISPLTYNPAYAGSFEGMSFTSLYSSQWVGFEGAPKTLLINGHGTFFGPNTGIGLELMHDEIGVTTDTKLLGNYAYHINLDNSWRLSLGIKSGVSWYNVDYSRLTVQNTEEFKSLRDNVTRVNINFGSGFYLHNESFYLGIGIPNVLKTSYVDSYSMTLANSRPNYYLSSGYKFDLENNIFLQPSFLMRAVEGAPINTLFASTLYWKDKFYASLNIDYKSTIGGFAGFRFSEKFMIGYAYDASTNNFSNGNDGIHSFFLNIRLEDYWKRERCSCYSF